MEKPKLIEDLGVQNPTLNCNYKKRMGIYECPKCGKHFRTVVSMVENRHTKGCGCLKYTHGLSKTKLYAVWYAMKRRCNDPTCKDYHNYGGIGVGVCDEWMSLYTFYDWGMNHGWKIGLDISRLDGLGNYEPNNCIFEPRWKNMQRTRLYARNTSGYRGVKKGNKNGTWRVVIRDNKKSYHLGYFTDLILAAKAYNAYVIEHKTHHPLNIIP